MNPTTIILRLGQILKLVRVGKLVQADISFDTLRAELQHIEVHLQRRYLSAGLGKVQGAEIATAYRQTETEDRYVKIRTRFAALRKAGKSVGEAEQLTARQFSVSVRTVRRAASEK